MVFFLFLLLFDDSTTDHVGLSRGDESEGEDEVTEELGVD